MAPGRKHPTRITGVPRPTPLWAERDPLSAGPALMPCNAHSATARAHSAASRYKASSSGTSSAALTSATPPATPPSSSPWRLSADDPACESRMPGPTRSRSAFAHRTSHNRRRNRYGRRGRPGPRSRPGRRGPGSRQGVRRRRRRPPASRTRPPAHRPPARPCASHNNEPEKSQMGGQRHSCEGCDIGVGRETRATPT